MLKHLRGGLQCVLLTDKGTPRSYSSQSMGSLLLSLGSPDLVYALLTTVLIYFVLSAFYRLFISPLRSVPGPWYATISDFWLTTHVLRLRRCRAIDDLFRKYGPIVRVSPNRVIFLDSATMKGVYGVSNKLNKSKFYKCLTTCVLTLRRVNFH